MPFLFYRARRGEHDLVIGLAGVDPQHGVDAIGSVPAALLCATALRALRPHLVISAGTCGGFLREKHEIAEVLLGTERVVFHDRRNSVPGLRESGIGGYPVLDSRALRERLSLRGGIVSSGDALDYSPDDHRAFAESGATLKEMEVAAVGWVCQQFRVPLLPVKAITDWVDHPAETGQQFLRNYAAAARSLSATLLRILDALPASPKT